MVSRMISAIVLFFLVGSLALAASWTTQISTADGDQMARSPDGKSTLFCSMRGGVAYSCKVVTGPTAKILTKPMTPRAGGSSWEACKCGFYCFEDQEQSMSVCLCKTCGSGGKLVNVLVSD